MLELYTLKKLDSKLFIDCCLHGHNLHLRKLIDGYRHAFLQIDIEFTKDTFDTSVHFICIEVFNRKSAKKIHVIAVLGFAETIHHHHSFSWYSVEIVIKTLTNVLEDIDFYPNHLNPSYCVFCDHFKKI